MNIDALIQALRWTPSEGATTEESSKQDSTTDQLRIESLVLENFKSFQSGPHVFPLSDITLTFGQNNSGKSNFARAIQLLAQSISSGTENGPPSLTFSGANGVSDDVKFEAGGFWNCLNRDYRPEHAAQYLKRSLASTPERQQQVDEWIENPTDGKWTWDGVSEGFHHTHRFSIGFDFVNTNDRPINLGSTLFHNPGHFVHGPEFGRLRLVLEFGLEGSNFSTRLNYPELAKELSRLSAPNKSPLLAFSVFGLGGNQDGSALMEGDNSKEERLLFRFEHDSGEEPSSEFNTNSRVFRLTHIDHHDLMWRGLINSIVDPEVTLDNDLVDEWNENAPLMVWARSPMTERTRLNRSVIDEFGATIVSLKKDYTKLRLTDLIVYAHYLYASEPGLDACCIDGENWESDRDATERLLWKLYQTTNIFSILRTFEGRPVWHPVSDTELLRIVNLLDDDEKEALFYEIADTSDYQKSFSTNTDLLSSQKSLIRSRGQFQTEPFPLSREELREQSRILRKMCHRTSVTSDEKSLFKSNIDRLNTDSKEKLFESHFCRVLICHWLRGREVDIAHAGRLDSDEYIIMLEEAGLELRTFRQVLQNDFENNGDTSFYHPLHEKGAVRGDPNDLADELDWCSQGLKKSLLDSLDMTIESIRKQMYNCFEINLTGKFEPTIEECEDYSKSTAQSWGGRQAQTWGLWGKDFDPEHFLHNNTPVPINLCVELLDLACDFCGRRNISDATLRVIPAHRPYANRSYTQDEMDSLLGESFRNDEALGQILTAMGMPHQEFCVEKDLDTGFSKIKFGDALLADSGTGITQLLPILSCLQNQYQTLVVQEPEAHLHPSMHSYVGFLLGSLAGSKQAEHLLVETHSEHLVRACAALVRAGLIRNDQLSIVWVDHSASSGSSITEVPVDASGRFKTKWPEGFFEERLEIAKWAKQQSEAN